MNHSHSLKNIFLIIPFLLAGISFSYGQNVSILAPGSENAVIYLPETAPSGVKYGCNDFITDAKEATGQQLNIVSKLIGSHRLIILPVVVDNDSILNKLELEGKIDLSGVRGKWESYLIQQVSNYLVIAGSCPRAVAYGLYEISEKSFGTDPLKLWTDFIPNHIETATWTGSSYFKGPTVKYRGCFVNDENYLINWKIANDKVVEPEVWAKIIETVARTRGNFITLPDEYNKGYFEHETRLLIEGRDMFLSGNHLQAMLVQTMNFTEFCQAKGFSTNWSWITNKQALLAFWEDKVKYNAQFKNNIWPIGLRGMNDRNYSEVDAAAPKDPIELTKLMNEIIKAQYDLLKKYIPENQIVTTFTMRGEPYQLYQTGLLELPKSCILVWCDSGSWAEISDLPNTTEQDRVGGNGIYYHLTYCDNQPVQWVSPKKIREQFTNAIITNKVTEYVIHNVGDIRELPLSLSAGFDILWNIDPWNNDNYDQTYTANWIKKRFEVNEVGGEVLLDIQNRYFDLEQDMRSTSIVEIVRPEVLKINNEPSIKAIRTLLRDTKFEATSRYRVSESQLKLNEPKWAQLKLETYNAIGSIPEIRKPFYNDYSLLHLETSVAVNRYAMGIRRAIDAAQVGDKSKIVLECDYAKNAMMLVYQKRNEAMHGQWENWFRGDYLWGDNNWFLRPDVFATEIETLKNRLLTYVEEELFLVGDVLVSSQNDEKTIRGIGQTIQLYAKWKSTGLAVDANWTVDRTDLASINSNGVITSSKFGSIIATATAKDGSKRYGSYQINIIDPSAMKAWEFTSSTENWGLWGTARCAVSQLNGSLVIAQTDFSSANTNFGVSSFSFVSTTYNYLVLRIKNQSPASSISVILWAQALSGSTYGAAFTRSVVLPVTPNSSEFKEYRINLKSYAGFVNTWKIYSMRIDAGLVNAVSRLSFDYIRFVNFTTPNAPTSVVATAGNAQASITLTAPIDNGGSSILDYTVTSNPGGITKTGTTSPIIVTGLTNGTAYTFTVTARNAAGESVASAASVSVKPINTTDISPVLESSENYLHLYPVPVSKGSVLSLMLNDLNSKVLEVSVVDLQGRLLQKIDIQGQEIIKISTSNFNSGSYFISIKTERNKIFKKFIVL
jgi:hypothetical protein